MSTTSADLCERLRRYGARPEDVVSLDQNATPTDQIRYLDLVRPPANETRTCWPRAVVEVKGQAVLYVVDTLADARPDAQALTRLRRVLAFRAGADHLALSEPGRLTVYPVAPSKHPPQPKNIAEDEPGAAALVPTLAFPPATGASIVAFPKTSSASAVHTLLLELLTGTTEAITNAGIEDLDALSLVGRALFIRFLVDRDVLSEADVHKICGASSKECFTDALRAARMCAWLDRTFNGDFLELPKNTEAWLHGLSRKVFGELSRVLSRTTSSGQQHFEWGKSWDDLLFNHIPVGLLSQVYEKHAHRFAPELAKVLGMRYTPRHIAEYMVDEAFFALGDKAQNARVLDPAVGGGVFLVAAFRRLAAEQWRARRKPPDTAELRRILYEQIRGFDVSEPALRLCSLGLYLTAIDLDPSPREFEHLSFEVPLLGSVLHDTRSKKKRHLYIGSLDGNRVGDAHRGQYDIVIGNPPWNTWTPIEGTTGADIDAQVKQVETTVRETVRRRLDDDAAKGYAMTDKVPDVPFLWRALDWAKEAGYIALALHGRILFKQSTPGVRNRNDIFHAVQVTGVLDGTALRDTKFWPEVRAPFCLLFARNTRPGEDASFWFVSPALEDASNDRGKIRIDDTSAQPVAVEELCSRSALLKTLSRGTSLDLGVLDRIERLRLPTLEQYWESQGWKPRRKGQGFKVAGSSQTEKSRKQKPAEKLWGMHALKLDPKREQPLPYLVEVGKLPTIPRGTKMQHPRSRSIYDAPLVLIPAALPKDREKPGAHLALHDVAYSESFTGFSCRRHPEAEILARYIFLLFNSGLHVYLALLTSSQFGIERDVTNVEDVLRIPFRRLETLPEKIKAEIAPLSQALISRGATALDEVMNWAATVYGLSRVDREVIRDTLAIGLPFAHTRKRAQNRPSADEVRVYAERLRSVVQPSLMRYGRRARVSLLRNAATESWVILQLDTFVEGHEPPRLRDSDALARIIEEADSLAATLVVAVHPPETLLIAVVAQYRYFTPSRARILGIDLIQEHTKTLIGEVN